MNNFGRNIVLWGIILLLSGLASYASAASIQGAAAARGAILPLRRKSGQGEQAMDTGLGPGIGAGRVCVRRNGAFGRKNGRSDVIRLRGGMPFLCFGGDDTDGYRKTEGHFLSGFREELNDDGTPLIEGWLLKRSWCGPFSIWRRVHASIGYDSYISYFSEGRHSSPQGDGAIPLQSCSAVVTQHPSCGLMGCCMSLGPVIRVRVSPQGRAAASASGRGAWSGWWGGTHDFAVLDDAQADDWIAAITAASASPRSWIMLKDLDMKVGTSLASPGS